MQSDFTVVLFFSDLEGSLFITALGKKKKNYTCLVFLPRWAHKISLTFTNVSKVGFHVCNMLSAKMKQRAK